MDAALRLLSQQTIPSAVPGFETAGLAAKRQAHTRMGGDAGLGISKDAWQMQRYLTASATISFSRVPIAASACCDSELPRCGGSRNPTTISPGLSARS